MLAAIAEKVSGGFLGSMTKQEIVELGTLCQSIATGSQIMEKGGS